MKNRPKKPIIQHNPLLPDSLRDQHKQLMASYRDTLEFADTKNLPKLNESLREFSDYLEVHIRDERELYMYLELVVSKSDGSFRDTRVEMKDIALSIKSLLNLHINTPISEETIERFNTDFSLIGKELLGRMRHEESHLFNDYMEK